jgi:NADH:ubiquinone oxidoreductase subunit 6 (subunit J)
LVIILGGAMATPYVLDNPLVTALLVLACLTAIFLTLRPEAKSTLPHARIKR